MADYQHIPVLAQEVIDLLQPQPNTHFVDGTLGGGGHAALLLERTAPDGIVIGFDLDPRAREAAAARLAPFGNRIRIVPESYARLAAVLQGHPDAHPISGILVDLGLSSDQLMHADRGFSFHEQGVVDMRFDPSRGKPAHELLNTLTESELTDLFRDYGEIPDAPALARELTQIRDGHAMTVPQLVAVVERSTHARSSKIHPATQVFQALRIAVNDELSTIAAFLPQAIASCAPGGRVAIISYHSLEDRIVKTFFKNESRNCICPPESPICRCGHRASVTLVTSKAVRPTEQEIAANRRSRSAKLRVVEKLT